MSDPFDFDVDPEDEERWAHEWAEADRHAAVVLAQAWPALLEDGPAPEGVADPETWLREVAETISPTDDPGLPAEEQASVYSLEHADWLAIVVGLARRGVGATFSDEDVVRDLAGMDEVDGAGAEDGEYVLPVEVLAPQWQALGVLDEDRGLTPAGQWALPRALHAIWSTSAG